MLQGAKALGRGSIRTRLIAAFLAIALVLVAVGAFSLNRAASLHAQLDRVTSRDLTPLADLRIAQNTAYQVTITGLVKSAATDPVVVKQMAGALQPLRAQMGPQLQRLVADSPAELRSSAQGLVTAWEAFTTADLAYQAGAKGPDAGRLNKQAADLFDKLGADFDAQAGRLLADAKKQKAAVQDTYATMRAATIVAICVGFALAIGLGVAIARNIRRRSTVMLAATDSLAAGNFLQQVPVDGNDELGRIAQALNTASTTLRAMISSVADSAETLRSSSERMSGVNDDLTASSSQTGTQAELVAAAAMQVSQNVQTVAAGSEQMMASVAEISRNATDAAQVARSAVEVAETANTTIGRLGDSSAQIGNVVKLITSIAEQTNLLALNATIEASRAGEAGKGFAVVASEVKELAQETAKATGGISRQIQSVQEDAAQAVATIARISEVIGQISDYASSIASAVEEQTATTSEMARNIAEAATSATQIADGIADVTTAIETTTGLVGRSQSASTELAGMSSELRELVGTFRFQG
jgi:methyl-accepting chemotaxis protein